VVCQITSNHFYAKQIGLFHFEVKQ
jgi:hypothetical protein